MRSSNLGVGRLGHKPISFSGVTWESRKKARTLDKLENQSNQIIGYPSGQLWKDLPERPKEPLANWSSDLTTQPTIELLQSTERLQESSLKDWTIYQDFGTATWVESGVRGRAAIASTSYGGPMNRPRNVRVCYEGYRDVRSGSDRRSEPTANKKA
jgi:hypothetical protein